MDFFLSLTRLAAIAFFLSSCSGLPKQSIKPYVFHKDDFSEVNWLDEQAIFNATFEKKFRVGSPAWSHFSKNGLGVDIPAKTISTVVDGKRCSWKFVYVSGAIERIENCDTDLLPEEKAKMVDSFTHVLDDIYINGLKHFNRAMKGIQASKLRFPKAYEDLDIEPIDRYMIRSRILVETYGRNPVQTFIDTAFLEKGKNSYWSFYEFHEKLNPPLHFETNWGRYYLKLRQSVLTAGGSVTYWLDKLDYNIFPERFEFGDDLIQVEAISKLDSEYVSLNITNNSGNFIDIERGVVYFGESVYEIHKASRERISLAPHSMKTKKWRLDSLAKKYVSLDRLVGTNRKKILYGYAFNYYVPGDGKPRFLKRQQMLGEI